jgi:simple sugar transport system permease protein
VTDSARPVSSLLSTAVALAGGLAIAAASLVLLSGTPSEALRSFFTVPFSSLYYLGNMLNKTGLFAMAGIGMSLAFRGGVFNLGGEGQVYASALTATLVLQSLPGIPALLGLPLALAAAAATGGLLAGLSGELRRRWDTDELISSFLLSSSVVYTIDYLITGPLRDSESFLLATPEVAARFHLPEILPPSHLNLTLIAALLLSAGMSHYLWNTFRGYELRMCGLNREFARYGGIPVERYYSIPMVLSGVFYGLTGALFVTGTQHMLAQGGTSGLGWNGLAVALVARNNPILAVPAAFVFAFLETGMRSAMVSSDFTFELGSIIQAVVLFLITARFFALGGIRRRTGRAA